MLYRRAVIRYIIALLYQKRFIHLFGANCLGIAALMPLIAIVFSYLNLYLVISNAAIGILAIFAIAISVIIATAFNQDLHKSGKAKFYFYDFHYPDYLTLALFRSILPSLSAGFSFVSAFETPYSQNFATALLIIGSSIFSPVFSLGFIYFNVKLTVHTSKRNRTKIPSNITTALAFRLRQSAFPLKLRNTVVIVWSISLFILAISFISRLQEIATYTAVCIVTPKLAQKLNEATWQPANFRSFLYYSISDSKLLKAQYKSLLAFIAPYLTLIAICSLFLSATGLLSVKSFIATVLIICYLLLNAFALTFLLYRLAKRKMSNITDIEATLFFLINLFPGVIILVCIIIAFLSKFHSRWEFPNA